MPSLSALQEELRTQGTITRTRRLATGNTIGGVPLTNGPLNHLLRNRVYLGEINHRGKSYPGEHASIVDTGVFDRVQVKLTEHRHRFSLKHQRSEAFIGKTVRRSRQPHDPELCGGVIGLAVAGLAHSGRSVVVLAAAELD